MATTNAARLLKQAGINFEIVEYEYNSTHHIGNIAASSTGIPEERVFKTLVTMGSVGHYYVFCIPVCCELDLKKCASAASERRVEMIHEKDLLAITGYIRGGCSPIGMKKSFPTFIEETAQLYDSIAISAGARGSQFVIAPDELVRYTGARYADLIL